VDPAQRDAVERYVKEQMAKLGLHGLPHVKRVQRLCMWLSKRVKGVDLMVVDLAALLHDVGKYVEKDNDELDHGKVSADMAEVFLKSVGFDEARLDAVCHAIRVHTHGEPPRSVEAKILHDADVLDKMGAIGIATLFIKACLIDTTIEDAVGFWRSPSRDTFVGLHALWVQKPHFYTRPAGNLAKRRNDLVYAFFKQLEQELELKDT